MFKTLVRLMIFWILASAQAALAEDMYRCGNTFQDTPCKGVASTPINEPKPKKPAITVHREPVEKKVVAAKEPASTLQADCKKRGEDANVIAKLREIGVPAKDQLSITTDAAQKALINDVYSRSGSSFQVQNAVEKECLQSNQKTTLTSNWMAKAKRMMGFGVNPETSTANNKTKPQAATIAKNASAKPAQTQVISTADPKPVEPAQPATAVIPASITEPSPQAEHVAQPAPIQPEPISSAKSAPAQMPAATPAPEQPSPIVPAAEATVVAQKEEAQEDTQGICSSLQAGMKNVADQKRKGGDAALMQDLKNQHTQLERIFKSSGC